MKTKIFILAAITFIFLSCEVEDTSGYGNYILKISNYTSQDENFMVYLDETFQGQLFAHANQSISGSLCDELVYAASANNVLVLTYVSGGDHTIKLVNSVSETVAYTSDFEMTTDGCVEQPLIID